MSTPLTLIRITAPHFCAGLTLGGLEVEPQMRCEGDASIIAETAPILSYMSEQLAKHCALRDSRYQVKSFPAALAGEIDCLNAAITAIEQYLQQQVGA